MLPVIAHAAETVLLVTGIVALVRSAFQYASRTQNWRQLNVVLFQINSLSPSEMRWWYVAIVSLFLGAMLRVLSFAFPQNG
ncbi:hypothetical protein [Enterovibrio paralichthyis]|uniref:hypothetical protein n=1 Tax=Enterovibrio paralichthyis TaxID=2853805 RepID=UPI001C44F2CC|nr:hypothetical protein [Enterovibrio paralichthyis]MBV7296658.1 hypothetical protein [Enterovibrio paralichthyis]